MDEKTIRNAKIFEATLIPEEKVLPEWRGICVIEMVDES